MTSADAGSESRSPAGRTMRFAVLWGPLLAGLTATFLPIITSGFRQFQTDPGDSRLVNYFLEHGYRWLLGGPGHGRLWDPPFFHPTPNVLAYSESMIGLGPLYWVWRAAGLPPDTAFQLWMPTIAVLNYAAAVLLLRRRIRVGHLAAGAGAFLTAFAGPRIAQLGHQHLLAIFHTLAFLYAVSGAWSEGARPGRRRAWIVLSALFLVLQAYAGFYITAFLFVALLSAAVGGAAMPSIRRPALALLRAEWMTVLLSAAGALAAVSPLLLHHLAAAAEAGARRPEDAEPMLPRIASWLFTGPDNWCYSWTADWKIFQDLPTAHEQQLGFGLLTAASSAAGLWMHRRRPWVALLGIVTMVLVLGFLMYPGGKKLWRFWFHGLPFMQGIRAVCRVGVLVVVPVAVGAALFLDRLAGRRRIAAALLAAACCAEQFRSVPSCDKLALRRDVAAVADRIEPGRRAFLLLSDGSEPLWKVHLDAMWAGLLRGVPTVNGYSGVDPPGWGLWMIDIRSPADEERVRRALAEWLRRNGMSDGDVQVIGPLPRARPAEAPQNPLNP